MARREASTRDIRDNRSKMPPRQRGNQRAEEILAAAFRLFAERGYMSVSIKDIARASRVNSALIYYYFESKEHLFVEALKHSAQTATSHHALSKTLGDDPIAEINFWFEANAKLAKPLGQVLRLMLDYRTSRKRSASVERLITDFYAAETAFLRGAIERGIKRGLFRAVDSGSISLFVSAHLDGLTVAAAIRPGYDLHSGLIGLQNILFAHLGARPSARKRAKGTGAAAKLRAVA